MVSFEYVHTDTRRHKKGFLIGLLTVVLVVWFIAYVLAEFARARVIHPSFALFPAFLQSASLLQNAIDKSPIIFLKLAENTAGETDIVISTPRTLRVPYSNDESSSNFSQSTNQAKYH
jgi:hypothetical protein